VLAPGGRAGLILEHPFFAGGMEGMTALLLAERPRAFGGRLIFVSDGALSRPRNPASALSGRVEPVGRPESAPALTFRAHLDANPVSTFAECALAR